VAESTPFDAARYIPAGTHLTNAEIGAIGAFVQPSAALILTMEQIIARRQADAQAAERDRLIGAATSLNWLNIAEAVWADVPSRAEQELAGLFAEAFATELHAALAQPADTEGA
jgi:hypothetical protein